MKLLEEVIAGQKSILLQARTFPCLEKSIDKLPTRDFVEQIS